MLADMYFDSLNSSLGPERRVEDVDSDSSARLTLESSRLSRHQGEFELRRRDQVNGNIAQGQGRGVAEGEVAEVPPPAYEEVIEQTQKRKA